MYLYLYLFDNNVTCGKQKHKLTLIVFSLLFLKLILTLIRSSKKDFSPTSETGVYCLEIISPSTMPLKDKTLTCNCNKTANLLSSEQLRDAKMTKK